MIDSFLSFLKEINHPELLFGRFPSKRSVFLPFFGFFTFWRLISTVLEIDLAFYLSLSSSPLLADRAAFPMGKTNRIEQVNVGLRLRLCLASLAESQGY